jgi:hypothetical protein
MKSAGKTISYNRIGGTTRVNLSDIIATLKDDLIEMLTNPDEEMLASEYIQSEIKIWENFLKRTEDKEKDEDTK